MPVYEPGFNDETWAIWLELKRELAMISIEAGGSISTCHGATRAGDAELVSTEVGENEFELMKRVKRMVDPENIMNPGKYLFDQA